MQRSGNGGSNTTSGGGDGGSAGGGGGGCGGSRNAHRLVLISEPLGSARLLAQLLKGLA